MVVFRALGFVPDRTILEHICYDFEDAQMLVNWDRSDPWFAYKTSHRTMIQLLLGLFLTGASAALT